MSERMTAKLTYDALRMALWRRKRPRGVILHSDRGSQYCAHDYRRLLKALSPTALLEPPMIGLMAPLGSAA